METGMLPLPATVTSAGTGVQQNSSALKEGLGTAICDILLDHCVLESLRLLLQNALPASIEGAEQGHALHLAVLGHVLEVSLNALQVLAALDTAGVVQVSGILEGVHV